MPKHQYATTCIKCGKPSDAVVCLNCFFQYENRSYKSKDCDGDCGEPFPEACVRRSDYKTDFHPEFTPEYDSEFESDSLPEPMDETEEAGFASLWEQEEFIEEPKEPEEPEPPKTPPQPNPGKSVSWFSRLPRF